MYDDVLSPRYTSRRMELWADFLIGSLDVKSSSFLTDFSPGDNASSRSQEGCCEEHQEEAGMLTAGDGSAGGGCGSTGAPCCPGALSGSKWGVAESLSSYQGAGMKLAGGSEETTEALCRARGGGSAEDEDKPMGQAAGGSSCSSGQEAWTPSADHALAGDNRGAADEARQESGVQVASSSSAPRGGGGGCNAEETATKPTGQEVGGGSGQEEAGALSSHRARAVGGDVRSSAALKGRHEPAGGLAARGGAP